MANIKPFSSLSSIRAMFLWTQAALPPSSSDYSTHTLPFSLAVLTLCLHLGEHLTALASPCQGHHCNLGFTFPTNQMPLSPAWHLSLSGHSLHETLTLAACMPAKTVVTCAALPRSVDRLRRGLASMDHCYSDFCVPWRLTLRETLPKLAILG